MIITRGFPLLATLGLGVAVLTIGCGSGDPSRTASNIQIAGGNGQNAQVGTTVGVRPSVLLTDASGDPVSGVRVTFTVASGGGSVTGASAVSDANGIATVGSWSLGHFVGGNTLNATAPGTGTVTFGATATAGAPSKMVAVTALSQTAVAGAPVPIPPAVKVTDAFDNGIPGVQVSFVVTVGAGHVTINPATTNANGVATPGSWVLDPVPGPNRLVASVSLPGVSGTPVTFNATGVTSAFNIDVRFLGTVSATQQQAFLSARSRLQALILGDLPNESINLPAGACVGTQPALNETIDDLVIFARVVAIDGPGMTLAHAGPCVFHQLGGGLPIIGVMEFDVADVAGLENNGTLDEVILHEMIHVVGFGVVWTSKGLLSGAGGSDPIFLGGRAITAFDSIGGNVYPGNPVPVENTGGAGTANSHWRETVFKNELMTGFINNGANPLSVVTASSLADVGYSVDLNQTDPYAITPPFTSPSAGLRQSIFMQDDIWRGPLYQLDSQGRPRPIPRR